MNRTMVMKALGALLLPGGPFGWAVRAVFWCLFGFGLVSIELYLIGETLRFPRDFLVASLVIVPLSTLAMVYNLHCINALNKMTKTASTDKLTGLLNRRGFFEAVENAEDGAMLVIDIDHFKSINDRYGHPIGDVVLNAIADHLRRNSRDNDILGRIGGEEFGLFLFGADSLEIDKIGTRICSGFVIHNQDVPAPIKVTMSIGAAYSAMSENLTQLFKNADEALYGAKHSGRARLNFWQPPTSGRV
ncbi:GGDEF domain-containing protein [Rhodobacteraceae bacterium]|nr:GGDEF domain-containing protein [Paracoccaceae bacterium]